MASGCFHALHGVPAGPVAAGVAPPIALAVANPMLVQVTNRDFLWDQLVDVVDDYFRIEREERVQLVGDVVTEGRLDTYHELAASILEPWRGDSVGRYNRWEATLQTIRKRAVVRVIPSEQGYLIDVVVTKEIEALPRPIHASAGDATFRNETDIRNRNDEMFGLIPPAEGWTPLGRDVALEQQILLELQARLHGFSAPVIVQ